MFGAFFWSSLEFGEKTLHFSVKIFFFGLHLNLGEKTLQLFQLSEKTFFLVFTSFAYLKKKSWSWLIPSMLKIGQNWGEIANLPPMLNKDRHPRAQLPQAKSNNDSIAHERALLIHTSLYVFVNNRYDIIITSVQH